MAIRIKTLEKIAADKTLNDSVYRDLTLDIALSKIHSSNSLIFPLPINGSDIKISKDLAAISNSLQNLFSTLPCQRVLFPDYGLNLLQYLFQPIDEQTAGSIGNAILTNFQKWEPRVTVRQVNVEADPDNNQYNINIIVDIPVLNLKSYRSSFAFNVKNEAITVIQSNQ